MGLATPPLDRLKRQLRTEAGQRRDAAVRQAGIGDAVAARVLGAVPVPEACVASAYWPIGSELDPRHLMERLHGSRHPVCLPVAVGTGRPLLFRAWRPSDTLEAGRFGTRVPAEDREELRPEVLFVPLLAFDRAGFRLGYGGGFYDRTLADLRTRPPVLAVGLAYADQEIPTVPRDRTDQRLDWIVTEAEAIEIRAPE